MANGIETPNKKYCIPGTNKGELPINKPVNIPPVAIKLCANAPFNTPCTFVVIRTAIQKMANGIKKFGKALFIIHIIPIPRLRIAAILYKIIFIFLIRNFY